MSLRSIADRAERAADRVDRLPRPERRLARLGELTRLQDVLDQEVLAEIVAMRAAGVPVQVIADRLGVTRQAVHRRLARDKDARQRAEGGAGDGSR